ncbi:MAG: hypothetical protein GY809_21930 [Planctomycetes bacterium]|nr:hypothetical protein [Planctomycetota bacterium]
MAEPVITWDFRTSTHGWVGNAQVAPVQSTPEGLVVNCIGPDPWIEGPAIAFPADHLAQIQLRLRSNADRTAQIFYGPSFVAERVHTFMINNDNQWHDYSVLIPETPGPRTRFRIDPCADKGQIVVESIRISAVNRPDAPPLAAPIPFDASTPSVFLIAGALKLVHSQTQWNALTLSCEQQAMSQGYTGEAIGIQFENETQWLALNRAQISVTSSDIAVTVTACLQDARYARWQVQRTFAAVPGESTLAVTTTVQVDHDRDVIHIPWLTLLPGFESFGTHKDQALFAGLEYLANEPSSSTADLTGLDHVRRMPDPLKVTFPLMAVTSKRQYLGLIWTPGPQVSPGFDSPDTLFGSGSHAFWLSGPAVGETRFANDLVAHTPMTLEANVPMRVQAWIIAGQGRSIVPAVQQYVRLIPLPPLPEVPGGHARAVDLLAHGWLDSTINHEGRFRHAVWGNSFNPAPAADAAAFMQTLSVQTRDPALSERLTQGVTQTLACLNPNDPYASSVSHIRTPLAPLLFGKVNEYVRLRHKQALAQLRGFDQAGRVLYRPQPDKPDYSKTHFAKHANGLGNRNLVDILAAATLCHDPDLTRQALHRLDQQTALYANTVPRGAQTWEIPLHTPDIMASAHMVRAYVLGYLLSDRSEYLNQARYWAWTGVPFVYLVNPTEEPTGPYATIAVLGATNWQAPVWLGQPVQWCGLVYGAALHELAAVDPDGPWHQLSQGITRIGVQMTWPKSDIERQGLLPDYFHLRAQVSDGPAINPGTLGAHLAEAFDQVPLYDRRRVTGIQGFIHAPGRITILNSRQKQITFTVETLGDAAHHILISGPDIQSVSVSLKTGTTWADCANACDESLDFMVIQARNHATIRLRWH